MRRTLLAWGVLGGFALALIFALASPVPPQQHPHDGSCDCTSDPEPPELLAVAVLPGGSGEVEIEVTSLPLPAGALEVGVSTEGPASLAVNKFAGGMRIVAGATESRRYTVHLAPGKAGSPAPAFIADATHIENGVALMQRSYRIPLVPESTEAASMPEAEPDGRGGFVRVFRGASQ